MAGFLPDTSCMVAAVCGWHEHHGRSAGEIGRRLASGQPMFSAAPALIEAYAVLTRLPAPHRLNPASALAILEETFLRNAKVVALGVRSYSTLLRSAPGEGIAGGRVYDAVIAACAVKAKASALLTFNEAHFLPFSGPALEVVVP